jgi:hypothetical protein
LTGKKALSLILAVVLAILCLYWACRTPQLPPESYQELLSWIECEDCESEDFDTVAAMGDAVVPVLIEILLRGPPEDREARYKQHLERMYGMVAGYVEARPAVSMSATADEYVDGYLGTYVAVYRIRAAYALYQMGGTRAREALDSATVLPLRADVRQVVSAFRDSLAGR